MKIPTAYAEGYAKAREVDRDRADNYIAHTTIGDRELDPLMREWAASMSNADLQRFVGAGIEGRSDILRDAPQSMREFFDNLREPPWLYYEGFRPGIRAFNANVDLMLVAFVTGVLVEGFSTLIAKSFAITKRVSTTVRRLRQNNRHMLEIFYPGGLYREGDGWKLSVRIRFVHSRIRSLLADSDEWQADQWGTPVSAAHLGFAISVFSQRLLEYPAAVGAKYTDEEKASVLDVWRYSGYLMGIPEKILYKNAADAAAIYRTGYLCEPPPSPESVAVANVLIQAIPAVAGVKDPAEREKPVRLAYRLSRALIGRQLADDFGFPKSYAALTLSYFRFKQRLGRLLRADNTVRLDNFSSLMQIAVYDEGGLKYGLPDHVRAKEASDW